MSIDSLLTPNNTGVLIENYGKTLIKEKSPAACYSLMPMCHDTVTASVLNFCVRDGNRCGHRAIATRLFSSEHLFSEN
jgi:hypothetical protein